MVSCPLVERIFMRVQIFEKYVKIVKMGNFKYLWAMVIQNENSMGENGSKCIFYLALHFVEYLP